MFNYNLLKGRYKMLLSYYIPATYHSLDYLLVLNKCLEKMDELTNKIISLLPFH